MILLNAKRGMAALCIAGLTLSACGASVEQVAESSGKNNSPSRSTTTKAESRSNDEASSTTGPSKTKTTLEVTESGFSVYTDYDDSSRAAAGAVIENSGEEAATFFEVVFSFKDADGTPVGTETAYVYVIGPGDVGYAAVDSVELRGDAEAVDVAAVVKSQSVFSNSMVPVAVTVSEVTGADYGDGTKVAGTAENETDEVQDSVSVTCVLRANDKIVGGASGYLDTMVPGASITWDATGSVAADTAECAAAASSS